MIKKRIAIIQSSYIPWRGYFDIINSVDEFIFFDDVQFTKRDWRSRNRIKTPHGPQWLTIPISVSGRYHQQINEAAISDSSWGEHHWNSIRHNYAKTRYFNDYAPIFSELYMNKESNLSRINFSFIKAINKILGIKTKLSWSDQYKSTGNKTARLVDICVQTKATDYLSGPSAKNYIAPELFDAANVNLHYMDYSGYPDYHQLFPPFVSEVSIIDLLFNEGPNAPKFMKSFLVKST